MSSIRSSDQIRVQSTDVNRTVDSAREYLNGFLDFLPMKPDVQVGQKENDFMLKFPDICQSFIRLTKSKNSCEEATRFDDESVAYQKSVSTFYNRTHAFNSNLIFLWNIFVDLIIIFENKVKLFDLALKICQYEYLIDGTESVWCKFLDNETLATLTYREDIKYHCKYGFKYNVSRLMTCDLVSDLIQTLEQFKTG